VEFIWDFNLNTLGSSGICSTVVVALAARVDSDSEEEAEEQMRMTFLGEVRKGGKPQSSVLAPLAEHAEVAIWAPYLQQSTVCPHTMLMISLACNAFI
jgi:hypothetical protein